MHINTVERALHNLHVPLFPTTMAKALLLGLRRRQSIWDSCL